MNNAVRGKLGWGCALTLALIGSAAWQARHHIREQAVAARWVAHTHRVLAKLNGLHNLAFVTDSAARRFPGTGQDDDLLQFQDIVNLMIREARDLRQLTADNPEQERRLAHFEFTAADCNALAQHVLELVRASDFKTAVQRWEGNGARSLRSRLEQLITEAGSHELQLLAARSASINRHATAATVSIVVGSLIAFVLLVSAGWQAQREGIRRVKVEAALCQTQDEPGRGASEGREEIAAADAALQAEIQERRHLEEALQRAHIERDIARLETGKLSIECKLSSLAELAQGVVSAMQPAAVGKGITLNHDIQPALPDVPLDENRIQQVINILVANALKFTDEGGNVTVAASEAPEDPRFLQVAVSDTSQGIEPEELEGIFDRLGEIETSAAADNNPGFGLGLLLCREFVLLHGGRIEAYSEPGKGSAFRFLLPKQPPVKRTSLLLVDDDPALRELLRQLLERADFAVATADSGRAALEVMCRAMPDLVVLDLAMPDLDGASTLKAIRERWGALPVILHTGFAEGELMERARTSSPFTLLPKPCAPQELITTVRQLVHHEPENFVGSSLSGEEPTLLTA